MSTENLPRINYDARDQSTIVAYVRQWVVDNRPELESDLFDSQLGAALIDALGYVFEQLAVTQDILANEVFLETCERFGSALKHAKKLGYKPKLATAGSVDCLINPTPSSVLASGVTIPAGTSVRSGNINLEVLTDRVLVAGLGAYTFTLVEGYSRSVEYISQGENFQSYATELSTVDNVSVASDSWSVYVEDELWEEVESIFLIGGAEKKYATEQTNDGRLIILFGDNTNGLSPASGDVVKIDYRETLGTLGNLSADSLESTVTGLVSGTPTTLSFYNPNASSGALDRESIESIKRYAPAYFKTGDKLITAEDYRTLANTFSDPVAGTVSKATVKLREGTTLELTSAFTEETLPGNTVINIGSNTYQTLDGLDLVAQTNPSLFLDPNTVDVYLWGETGGSQIYGPVSSALKEAFLAFADERSLATVRVVARDGDVKVIDLDFGQITVSRSYALAAVQTAIDAALDGFFRDTNLQPGDYFRVSDIVNLVEQVDGVLHFDMNSPVDDISVLDTEIYVPGTITYTVDYESRANIDFRGRY